MRNAYSTLKLHSLFDENVICRQFYEKIFQKSDELTGSPQSALDIFKSGAKSIEHNPSVNQVRYEDFSVPPSDMIASLDDLPALSERDTQSVLDKIAVCKLNGGLGTSMGCKGPKSLIEVRDGYTFLDMALRQVATLNAESGINIPVLLMNSFYTAADTDDFLKQYQGLLTVRCFSQNRFYRLRNDSMQRLKEAEFGSEAYYPPGHGDFFPCIYQLGILDELLAAGKTHIFISNIDNLGAVMDVRIPFFMENNGIDFLCEVATKTRNDVKGGTFVLDGLNRPLRLLEYSQIPQQHRRMFEDIDRFQIFNTNNIWVDLRALKSLMVSEKLETDIIFNEKQINGISVVQIETPVASAIRSFSKPSLLSVNRLRFIPVKKTEDLFLVKSGLFYEKDGQLCLSPKRKYHSLPLVRLGENYKTVNDVLLRMPELPDITDLDLLTITGNVHFGRNVSLISNVIINCTGERLDIPDNTVLNNKVIHGILNVSSL